jgi:hypothetical protein
MVELGKVVSAAELITVYLIRSVDWDSPLLCGRVVALANNH